MLKVRFAEVSRSAMQELGVNFFGGPTGDKGWMGRSTTGQFPAPGFDVDKGAWITTDFLNVFGFMSEDAVGATMRALKGRGLFESLAEPNLVTQDGKEASFLAGGEFPYPVVQGGGRQPVGHDRLQGIRRPPAVYADPHRRRIHPSEGRAGSEHARLRQRGHARRVPRAGAQDAPHRDGSRAPRRPDVRDFRTARSEHGRDAPARARDRRHSDSRLLVPQPGVPEEQHRARRDDHAAHRAARFARRDAQRSPASWNRSWRRRTRTIPMPPARILGNGARLTRGPGPHGRAAAHPPPRPLRPSLRRHQRLLHPFHQCIEGDRLPTARRRSRRRKRSPGSSANRPSLRARPPRSRPRAQQKKRRSSRKSSRSRGGPRPSARGARRSSKQSASRSRPRSTASAGSNSRSRPPRPKWSSDKLAKEQARRDAEQQKIENARLEEERKIAEKHQKAQEKLAREQASRNDELEKLITQYKRLTGEKQ